jgi:hypothetical protein
MSIYKAMKNKPYITTLTCMLTVLCTACTDFLSVEPPKTQLASSQVFADNAAATSAISGIYASMMSSGSFASGGTGSMTLQAGLSADEFMDLANSSDSRQFFRNSIIASNSTIDNMWSNLYQYIFFANTILENVNQSTTLTPSIRKQVQGEAYFVRAFSYFYLLNLFGEVPLAVTTDFKANASLERSSKEAIYDSIVADLLQAKQLMGLDYSHAGGNRVRPNTYAAAALLARVYLFNSKWQQAADEASIVINNSSLYKMSDDLNQVFLKNSEEAIWQLMPTIPQYNTYEGLIFHSASIVALSDQLIDAFEDNDLRRTLWVAEQTSGIGTFQSSDKYKVGDTGQPVSEYSMVLRLAELYLVRAEARTHLVDLTGANTDLNVIRGRSGLDELALTSEDALLSEILKQRQLELFSEWGHRWLDLKRTGNIDSILKNIKPEWTSSDALYPIPKIERDNNARLSQNPGY